VERTRRTRLTAGQRRETILEAATEVFAASGYHAGKVSDVAARIGVTEPVIFQNFGSKSALFAAVLDRLAGDVRASLDDLADHHDSVAGLLTHILDSPDAAQPHGPRSHRTLFADAAVLIADPEAGEAAVRVARVVAAHLADLVRHGQLDGSVRGDVSPDAAAWLLLSVLATRPLRAGAMAGDDGLEPVVGGLALRAILGPGQLPVRVAEHRVQRLGSLRSRAHPHDKLAVSAIDLPPSPCAAIALHGDQVAQFPLDGLLVAEPDLEAVGGLGAPESGLPSQPQPSFRLRGGLRFAKVTGDVRCQVRRGALAGDLHGVHVVLHLIAVLLACRFDLTLSQGQASIHFPADCEAGHTDGLRFLRRPLGLVKTASAV
jgi:AcrR family transcriptional regulator